MNNTTDFRLRTINQAAAYIRQKDPETALTKTAIRSLVTSNTIPSVKIGTKYLFSLEALEEYLSGEKDGAPHQIEGV